MNRAYAIIFAIGLAMNTAFAADRPYCTVASEQGAYWWTWTKSDLGDACRTAMEKVRNKHQSVDKRRSGYYSKTALNKGRLQCKQGSKSVIGSGSSIFENALNMAKQLGWSGCVFGNVKF